MKTAQTVEFYDPSQRRDENGRWSASAGGISWQHGLSKAEIDAVVGYGMGDAFILNRALRLGKVSSLSSEQQQQIAHIDAAISKQKIGSMVVYRGGALSGADSGFLSTSPTQEGAVAYARSSMYGTKQALYRIHIQKPTNGIRLPNEVLLPRNTKLTVTDVGDDGIVNAYLLSSSLSTTTQLLEQIADVRSFFNPNHDAKGLESAWLLSASPEDVTAWETAKAAFLTGVPAPRTTAKPPPAQVVNEWLEFYDPHEARDAQGHADLHNADWVKQTPDVLTPAEMPKKQKTKSLLEQIEEVKSLLERDDDQVR